MSHSEEDYSSADEVDSRSEPSEVSEPESSQRLSGSKVSAEPSEVSISSGRRSIQPRRTANRVEKSVEETKEIVKPEEVKVSYVVNSGEENISIEHEEVNVRAEPQTAQNEEEKERQERIERNKTLLMQLMEEDKQESELSHQEEEEIIRQITQQPQPVQTDGQMIEEEKDDQNKDSKKEIEKSD